MLTFEVFEEALQTTLANLHNPIVQPPELIYTLLCPQGRQDREAVQEAITAAIGGLAAETEGPSGVRLQRFYAILSYRFVRGLSQNEIALRLNLSSRHLRREQQMAIQVLAQRLWSQYGPSKTTAEADAPPQEAEPTWYTQMRQELATLQERNPDPAADAAQEVQRVVRLAQPLAAQHQVTLACADLPAGLTIAIHPAVVRQILLAAIEKLVQQMAAGEITFSAGRSETGIDVTVVGAPVTGPAALWSDFVTEVFAVEGGSVTVDVEPERAAFCLHLPAVGKVTVLVIDDNADLVYLYRRYTADTQYQIHHLAGGKDIQQRIEALRPDMIVLDIMLPDVDGWEMLIDLHEHPATRAIPVVVCSVVRRQELARVLGAAVYLPKPVRRQEFIEALDQARSRALSG